MEKRLSSNYHKQWAEGRKNAASIASLRKTLAEKLNSQSKAGLSTAAMNIATIRFFSVVGNILGIGLEVVRAIGYGVLWLLLEVSTLCMISLSGALREKSVVERPELNEPVSSSDSDTDKGEGDREKSAQLIFDILNRQLPPVLRTIKSADYGLSLDQIRQVLRDLHAAGILETGIRNSYKLSEKYSI